MVLNAYTPTSKSSSTIYTIQKRKTYGYFEKGELMKYKIILVAAVFLMVTLLRELKNMEE